MPDCGENDYHSCSDAGYSFTVLVITSHAVVTNSRVAYVSPDEIIIQLIAKIVALIKRNAGLSKG